MEEIDKKHITGIRIRTFNACMIVLSSLIFICLIFNTLKMPEQYHDLIVSSDEYMACEKYAAELNSASDYLTEQVQLYVVNMDMRNMQNYFTEANETRRREKALEELQQHETTEYIQESLEQALQVSNDLMDRGGFDNLRRLLKTSTTPLTLLIIDVDTFKQVNDTYGHEIGDRILQKVAAMLAHIFRASDYVIRLGGDEFAVVCPE